jgi:hypothetical protein
VVAVNFPIRPICPYCGPTAEALLGPGRPTPGGLAMCAQCRVFLIFTESLTQRVLSNQEWAALPFDQRERLTRLRDSWTLRRPAVHRPPTSDARVQRADVVLE